jgi:DNA-binding ferritin-like protein
MYSEVWQHHGHTSGDPIVTHTGLHLEEHNDTIDERVGVPGRIPIRSIGEFSRPHRIGDSASAELTMREMLAALLRDSRVVAKQMRRMCARCRAHSDLVSARLLDDPIDEAEGRYWFLFEMHARIEAGHRTGGSDVK